MIEPFRIKMIEEINLPDKEKRKNLLKNAGYNVFQLKADDIYIDLLTDSGVSAMSDKQWAEMLKTKQAYAGSNSYYELEKTVKDIFGFKFFVPVHQGRAAEHILFSSIVKPGNIIPNNSHFDTTQANIKFTQGLPKDFVIEDAYDAEKNILFKGNMDIEKLDNFVKNNQHNIPLIMTTITNNAIGGQPVSMENIKQTSALAKKYNIPFFIDACRFAENCYFIKKYEQGYQNKTIKEIANEIFSYASGCTFSAKKDGLTNIGGILATNDETLFEKMRDMLVITEGFPTYGGLACRELSAIAQGLKESTQENYLEYRCEQVRYLWEKLDNSSIPIVKPAGGHAVFIDGKKFFEHIPQEQFPSQALVVELYTESGVRAVELGTSAFGQIDKKTDSPASLREPARSRCSASGGRSEALQAGKLILPKMDLMRLAIPRRVYTNNHLDYVAENIIKIYKNRKQIKGLRKIYSPPLLGHFLAKFEKL